MLILTLVLAFTPASNATAKKSDSVPKPVMRKQEYLGRLKIELSRTLCAEDGIQRCFLITAEQCKSLVDNEFSKCLTGKKIPDPVPLTGFDVEIAEATGACLGGKIGKTFEKQFKNAGDCVVRK